MLLEACLLAVLLAALWGLLAHCLLPALRLRRLSLGLPPDHFYFGFFPFVGHYFKLMATLDYWQNLNYFHQLLKTEVRFALSNYGDRPLFVFMDPDLCQQCFLQMPSKTRKQQTIWRIIHEFEGQTMFLSHGEQHVRRRKLVSQLFNFSYLARHTPALQALVCSQLAEASGKTVDAKLLVQEIASRAVVLLLLGKQLPHEQVQGRPFHVFMLEHLKEHFRSELASLRRNLLDKPSAAWEQGNGLIRAWVRGQLQSLSEQEGDCSFVMQYFKHGVGSREQRLEDAASEFISLFGAGADTTSIFISFFISCLARHPSYLPGLRQEVDSYDLASFPANLGKDLPRLNAFIREVQRLYGPANQTVPREALEDLMIGDVFVPRGALLSTKHSATHVDERLFKRAMEFRPERWLEGEGEGGSFAPFSGGGANCIGQHLAMRVIRLVAIGLLKEFDLALDPSFGHVLALKFTFQFRDPMMVTLRPRLSGQS